MAMGRTATLADIPAALRSLGGALPAPLRRLCGFEPQRLLLDLAGDRIVAQFFDGHRAGSRQVLALDEAAAVAALRSLAARPLDEIVLRLGDDAVLSTELTLPNAAARALPALLPFELERLAPLPLNQLCHGHVLLAAGRPGLRVLLQMAPRAAIEAVLQRLAGFGLRPDRVIGSGEAVVFTRLNLLPGAARAADLRPLPPRRLANRAAWILALLALAAALASPFLHLAWQSRQVQAESAALRAQLAARQAAEPVRGLQTAAAQRLQKLQALQAARPAAVLVLEALTRALPDDAWLTQLNLADGQIEIVGQARAATALVPLLEAMPMLAGVRFLTPVTRDAASGRERFHFALLLKPAGGAP
ncbi:PilN domain-containing protein [Ferrovibrio sp.]|uniref:PilN domain-containing protein n=1 Tax=Ferrovibrio sp. TaxID=1917215 RepID=UPI0025BCA266|nr:PilN domain-containing protein [Ferrovibrio sp.]